METVTISKAKARLSQIDQEGVPGRGDNRHSGLQAVVWLVALRATEPVPFKRTPDALRC
jgi:hypothetical protein